MQDFYSNGIHKVQDYIDDNYGKNISVEEMAEVAGFSRFHFSRIFKAILQESPMEYVNRVRLEQALFFLSHREDMNMTDIALELGYSDSAVFTRAFKKHFQISPSAYRKRNSTKCKESYFLSSYNKPDKTKKWTEESLSGAKDVRIERISAFDVVYVRHTGDYRSLGKKYGKLVHTLFTESKKQNLLCGGESNFITIYHDNPEFGIEEQFRTSLCLTYPKECKPVETQQLGKMTIEGGLYMIGYFEIYPNQFEDAWDYMYQQWIIGAKHMPRNYSPFELYINNPNEEKDHLIKVEIYVPLEE